MAKTKNGKHLPAITMAAGLAARSIARLEAAAKEVHAVETAKRDRELQLVSTSQSGFSALIRHGKTIVEISGNDFSVRQID
jgi:hypothetical protein